MQLPLPVHLLMESACVASGSMTFDSGCGPRGDLSNTGGKRGLPASPGQQMKSVGGDTRSVVRQTPGGDGTDQLRDFDRTIGRRDLPDKEMLAGENRKSQGAYPQSEGHCQSE